MPAEPLLVPVGHAVGAQHRAGTEPVQVVRRGARFEELAGDQYAVWTLAHGSAEAVANEQPWPRGSVAQLAAAAGVLDAPAVLDALVARGLLAEVPRDPDLATDFAKTHRLVPLMLGLGNSTTDPWTFGIGFPGQPLVQVGPAIYDLWQWSAMDDSLWGTCQGAADAARRGGVTDPGLTEPAALLGGLLDCVHALLLSNAAYVDVDFRLRRPQRDARTLVRR